MKYLLVACAGALSAVAMGESNLRANQKAFGGRRARNQDLVSGENSVSAVNEIEKQLGMVDATENQEDGDGQDGQQGQQGQGNGGIPDCAQSCGSKPGNCEEALNFMGGCAISCPETLKQQPKSRD